MTEPGRGVNFGVPVVGGGASGAGVPVVGGGASGAWVNFGVPGSTTSTSGSRRAGARGVGPRLSGCRRWWSATVLSGTPWRKVGVPPSDTC